MKFFIFLPYVILAIIVLIATICICYNIIKREPEKKIDSLGILLTKDVVNMFYYALTQRIVFQMKDGTTKSGQVIFLHGNVHSIHCDDGTVIPRDVIPNKFIKTIEEEELKRKRAEIERSN